MPYLNLLKPFSIMRLRVRAKPKPFCVFKVSEEIEKHKVSSDGYNVSGVNRVSEYDEDNSFGNKE